MSVPVTVEEIRRDDPKVTLAKYLRRCAKALETPDVLLTVKPMWLSLESDNEGRTTRLKVDVELAYADSKTFSDYMKDAK